MRPRGAIQRNEGLGADGQQARLAELRVGAAGSRRRQDLDVAGAVRAEALGRAGFLDARLAQLAERATVEAFSVADEPGLTLAGVEAAGCDSAERLTFAFAAEPVSALRCLSAGLTGLGRRTQRPRDAPACDAGEARLAVGSCWRAVFPRADHGQADAAGIAGGAARRRAALRRMDAGLADLPRARGHAVWQFAGQHLCAGLVGALDGARLETRHGSGGARRKVGVRAVGPDVGANTQLESLTADLALARGAGVGDASLGRRVANGRAASCPGGVAAACRAGTAAEKR